MAELKEGLIGGAVNLYFIYKFLRILTTPWEKSEAFKLGIVDDDGKILKKKRTLKTSEEKEAYTMMHRLVWKLKRLMEKIPFGKSRLASYAAALWLIKEHKFQGTEEQLQESFLTFLETDWKNDALILKENHEGDMDKKTFSRFKGESTIELNEALKPLDKSVIDAFYYKKEKEGKVVSTDGDSLWKNGLGGQEMAIWNGRKIKITGATDSKSTESILKYMKKSIPSGLLEAQGFNQWIKEGWKKGTYTITDVKTGKVLGKYNSGAKAQKAADDIFQKGDYDAISVEVDEEVKLDEKGTAYPATVDTLKKIVKDKQHQTVMFDKGQALVDLFTASAMVQVYDALKPATKKKFEAMIKSKEGFMKSQAFAMKMAK